jgi:serine protease SohB
MSLLLEVLAFALKGLIIVFAVLVVAAGIAAIVRRGRHDGPRMRVRELNVRFRELSDAVRGAVLGRKRFKKYLHTARKERKARKPADKKVFVLDFHGDIGASAVVSLREEISALLPLLTKADEVVVRLESSGGMVHAYGLAASQLARLKARGVRLVVCVDKVAASGGYMMACLADELLAAPFAIVGSIGVVAQVPNLHRLLERHGVDYEEMTAGEFKRTVSLLGKISPEGRRKFQEQLEDTHVLFKEFVAESRPALDLTRVSTGEYWYGRRALELALVDKLQTSDDYLMGCVEGADVYQVSYKPPQAWRQRVAGAVSEIASRVLATLAARAEDARLL